jgi:uncharacterized membrane protein
MSLKHLDRWAAAGLISAEQAQAIRRHEESRTRTPFAIYGLVGLGVVTVATGLISVVAANWGEIPHAFKLAVYFAGLAALAALWVKREEREGLAREGLILGIMGTTLAGIGLVAQLYNIQGDGWSGLLFWLTLVLPVTLFAKTRLPAFIWFGGLAVAVGIWTVSGGYKESEVVVRVAWGLALALVLPGLGLWRGPAARLPAPFAEAATVYGTLVTLAGVTTTANVAWAMSSKTIDFSQEAVRIALAALVLGGALMLGSRPRVRGSELLLASFAVTTLGLVAAITVPHEGSQILGCLVFLGAWSFAAAAAARAGRKRLFDVATLVIAGRFVGIYFEIFGSLLATGFGLIVSGAVILGVAWGWYKSRGRLAQLAGVSS